MYILSDAANNAFIGIICVFLFHGNKYKFLGEWVMEYSNKIAERMWNLPASTSKVQLGA